MEQENKMNREKTNCEFCGKKKFCMSKMFLGMYCIECHKIVIEESRDAIKDIKSILRRIK